MIVIDPKSLLRKFWAARGAKVVLLVIVLALSSVVPPAQSAQAGSHSEVPVMGRGQTEEGTLISFSRTNDVEGVRRLLRSGANPNAADGAGQTPLMWAATHQSGSMIELLLQAGANPCARDSAGHTAFWHGRRRILDFVVPFRPGMHGTIFLPRLFPTRATRLLKKASRGCSEA